MSAVLLHCLGYTRGFTGYNIHARNFFAALSRQCPTLVTDLEATREQARRNAARLEQLQLQGTSIVNIAIHYGSHLTILDRYRGRKIGFAIWESTKIPDDWTLPLNALDQIWTPSYWGKTVLEQNGFPPEKIRVVPEGVDPQVFNQSAPRVPQLDSLQGFKFLHVGKFEERKCTRELITAFDREFRKTDKVHLVLSCHNPFIDGFDINRELRALRLSNPEKIRIIPPIGPHDVFACIYASCDAFVYATRAEGWGLPIIEAMACGLPTIATHYSAPTDYLDEHNAYLLNYSMETIQSPYFQSASGDFGQWAKPDFEHLRALMRYIYEHADEARLKGERAATDVRERWTWDHAAKKALAQLEIEPAA